MGDIYDEEQILKLMQICAKHQIHFISDEIYALSIHNVEQRKNFKRFVTYNIKNSWYDILTYLFSVLCMDNLPDPQRTHFLWGMSKDFGLASFRFGVLHTLNPNLIKIMEGMCLYSSVEGHIQQIGGQMLKGRIHKLH